MSTSPSPPAPSIWPIDTLEARVAARLRINPGDEDFDRVTDAVYVAVTLIDVELDREVPDDDEDSFDAGAFPYLVDAAVQLAVERFQAKDASYEGAAGIDPSDPVATVRAQVRPAKRRWGLA